MEFLHRGRTLPLIVITVMLLCGSVLFWYLPTVITQSMPVSTWKTYNDPAHGFSVQFPHGWTMKPLTGGDGFETPVVYLNTSRCTLFGGCTVAAGVDEFTISVLNQSLAQTLATAHSNLTRVHLNGQLIYVTPQQQGIEGMVQTAYVAAGETTVSLTASGKRIAQLRTVASTVKAVTKTGTVACTMEAKVCPDGSTVGRTGPNCEFAACPTVLLNGNSSQ